jgi:light-harvesting complex I chlorophyll a/b binding protein 1
MALLFVPSSSVGTLAAPSATIALHGVRSAQQAHLDQLTGQKGYGSKSSTFVGFFSACAVGVASARGQKSGKSRARAFDPAVQEGVTEPFGFFDPLDFTKGKDAKGFRQLRVAEIKHGRVAMMASIGMVLPHLWRAPGFENVPCGIGAVFTEMGGPGFAALVLGAGLHELVLWKDDESKDPGDFGDPFKFSDSIRVERNYELNNGRMAMFAVLGQIVAELVTGKDAVQQLGF